MIKIDDHTEIDLDEIAEKHYTNLISPINADGKTYHATRSLIGRIEAQRLIDQAIPNPQRVAFWDYLLAAKYSKLKEFIIGRPQNLKSLIDDINNKFTNALFSNNKSDTEASVTEFGEIIKTVFNYKTLYRSNNNCETNCQKLELIYCPYCNENTIPVITIIDKQTGEDERKALLQLDHFYPQSRHPYLSLSFFNLVPGCSSCNANLKLEKNFDIDTHFNPFDKRLDDFFEFQITSIMPNCIGDVVIDFIEKNPHPDNSIIDFRLMERYNISHKSVAFNLYKTFRYRSNKMNNSISKQIRGLIERVVDSNNSMLEKYGIPLNQNEINSVHLGKLKRDIIKQFGLL